MNQMFIALAILAVLIVLFITEPVPIVVSGIAATVLYAWLGIIPVSEIFNGYNSNNIVLMIGMMVVGSALFHSGITDVIGERMVKLTGKNERNIIIATMVVSCMLSAVCSNMGVMAALAPLVTAMCVTAGFGPSKALLALLFGAQLGGFCTLVGVPTNVYGNSLLVNVGYESMGLFDITPFGLGLSVVGILYFAFLGMRLIPDTGFVPEFAQTERHPLDKKKAIISCGTLFGVLTIIAINPAMIPSHVAAVLGALVVVATGCMNSKEAIRSIDWNCALMMGSLTVVSTGLNNSGVGDAMANLLMKILGNNPSPYVVTTVLFFGTVILTQFISNTASILLFMPVAISVAQTIDINVISVGMVIILAGAACYATPFAAPQNLMTIGWTKYRFVDFVKAGVPMVLLTYVVVMILVPFCLPF